jgi:murein DD-endopeptidase MepM/ murein hydrolase activator NlpD
MADLDATGHRKNGQISIYVVRKGDTLSEIAKMFDVSVNTIRWANDLGRKETIRVGQELVILPITGVKYTVKRGGTIRDIVKKVGGNVDEAAEFNNVDPDEELAKGTEVIIPNAEIQEPKAKARRVKSYVRSYGNGKTVYAGYFMRPVKGGVKTQNLHGHNAVDIAAPVGTAIYAAASGKVIISRQGGWNGGYGTYIVISHPNGTQTLYAHNSKNFVSRGDWVKQGQVIAAMGSTGRSTGSHVHFEIRGARNPF